ncbi:hypothetical protein SEA_EMIANNA_64 [Gordonia phage Emianna]|uniref:Uncharacterized protein n=2 Tax=Foxborovirus TaxID=2948710 RepID=A0A385UDB7_9CAUD|nr:hypothetical protein KNU11_gp64 [Gordonia phage KidneyBean]YP_010098952.1 hypothetical protein KNU15_gp64 [Gordonia phage Emianna]AYD84178.1 hypothetical protein SEA_JIFALL16_63 [Gordonia phage Jifall16]AYD84336.1 hypothetical protein SEA_KURT_64 [Gordonia phage Kurt]AYB69782.1 hypothetical protein SEA_KIDNEYBEAN_64 [Gordonia phage KidneyBean]AYD83449.1 hypothetical protein SEA_EMIANNA_64 [Gordonia phage Emianna]
MGVKLKLKLGAEAAKVKATEGYSNYSGPVPPMGVYSAKIKQIGVKPTRAGDKTMLVTIIEFDAPKGHEHEKYNGYAIFHRLVIPESMEEEYIDLKVGQINRLFDAISGDDKLRAVFWGGNAVMDDKGEKIIKLGQFSMGGKGFKGIPVVVSTKNDSYTKKEKGADGTIKKTPMRQLRVNDIYPSGHEVPSSGPVEEEVIVDDDEIVVDDDDVSDDPTDYDEDEQPEKVVAATKKRATRRKPKPEPEPDPEDEDEPEPEEDPIDEDEYVDEDGDEDGYVADEPEDGDEDGPEPEPEPTGRKRRSAF